MRCEELQRQPTMSVLSLASDFSAADETAWMALVEKALRGAKFEDALVSRTYDGLAIKPLYTPADAEDASGSPVSARHLEGLRRAPGERPWDIRQLYADADPAAANRAILADLEGGVSSLCLKIAAPGQTGIRTRADADLGTVLDGVHLDYAGISLCAGANTTAAAEAKSVAQRAVRSISLMVGSPLRARPVAPGIPVPGRGEHRRLLCWDLLPRLPGRARRPVRGHPPRLFG